MRSDNPRDLFLHQVTAADYLAAAERVLHDLPDHLCPTDLLARIRLHNAAGTPASPPGEPPQ